jgi:hypothetical protein
LRGESRYSVNEESHHGGEEREECEGEHSWQIEQLVRKIGEEDWRTARASVSLGKVLKRYIW